MFWKWRRKRKRFEPDSDRRREPRHRDETEIILRAREDPKLKVEEGVYRGWSKDASPSGMKIDCDFAFPVGTVFDLRILPSRKGREIQAAARVVWVKRIRETNSYEIGLEFVETSVNTILDIVDHIYRIS